MIDLTEDKPDHVSDLHWLIHLASLAKMKECFEHDLVGPASDDIVFATCTKCSMRFKVRIDGKFKR